MSEQTEQCKCANCGLEGTGLGWPSPSLCDRCDLTPFKVVGAGIKQFIGPGRSVSVWRGEHDEIAIEYQTGDRRHAVRMTKEAAIATAAGIMRMVGADSYSTPKSA